jgi:hypothetical protein
MQEIFDFNLGDTYQYRETYPYPENSNEVVAITTRYTINDKWITGHSINYEVSGLKETVYSCHLTDPECPVWYNVQLYDDVLVFTDSANHFLNFCSNQLIPITQYTKADLYTYVKIELIDSIQHKRIGGSNNIFEYNNDRELEKVYTVQVEMDYAAHLGLVKSSVIEFESTHEIVLEGYVIDGDTTGTIMDSTIENPTISNSIRNRNELYIYPNPSSGILYFGSAGELNFPIEIELINSIGQSVFKTLVSENFIDITGLEKGVYFFRIKTSDLSQTEKVLLF